VFEDTHILIVFYIPARIFEKKNFRLISLGFLLNYQLIIEWLLPITSIILPAKKFYPNIFFLKL